MNIAVFFDRDGTICKDLGYIDSEDKIVVIRGAGEAIRKLNEAGFKVVIITTQSGVARGYFTIETLQRVNKRLTEILKKDGAQIDGIYFCPHHPDENCECRKPKPGLILKAKRKFNLNLKNSWVVGDKKEDIELGKNAGSKSILVLTGYGKETKKKVKPDYTVSNIKEAVKIILKHKNCSH